MFKNLLTPFRTQFDAFTASPSDNDAADELGSPEDFARDVLVELMRNSMDRLKEAEGARSRIDVSPYLIPQFNSFMLTTHTPVAFSRDTSYDDARCLREGRLS
jgi:hypothetical protein